MWNDIVSQLDATVHLLSFAVVDLFYRFPLVFSGTVVCLAVLASMLCFEFRKAEKIQATWDAERRKYDRPIRFRQ